MTHQYETVVRELSLPVEITTFVGRQRELTTLGALIGAERLVTVTGPGGVGKTRLALRAAAGAADGFADGVCLVELSGLHDAELLAATIGNALGLVNSGLFTTGASDAGRLDEVTDFLRDRDLLLVLDTCEHLVDACAMFADVLLRSTASVTVLATSRQPLDVPGEHVFTVAPLGTADAVELFAQRAATVTGGFQVTPENRHCVEMLCERLDGVPLALELATVRLRALPLEELVQRLEDRFRLLTGGRRAALPHHQTLLAATEWSYDLCTPAERELWARLSVFAGSFGIGAVEEVCGGDDASEILPTLVGLVDKSVVLRDGQRYRLLDTIREFGAGKLGADQETRRRYVGKYLDMAESFAARFADDQLRRYLELRAEHHNIRGAIAAALATGLDVEAARLVSALDGYWHIAGLPREGRYWASKVLVRFPGPSQARARLLITRCFLVTGAEADGREGIALAEELGDEALVARGYLSLHLSLAAAGRLAEAADAGIEAERRLRELSDVPGLHMLDAQVSQMYAVAGQLERALARCEDGLTRSAELGEVWSTSYLYYTRGLVLFQQERYDLASQAVLTALTMKTELGDTMGVAHCLEVLAWVAARTGRAKRCAWLLGAAGALWQRSGRRVSGNPVLERFHQEAAEAAEAALGASRYAVLRDRGAAAESGQVAGFAVRNADEPPADPAARAGVRGAEQAPSVLTGREQEIAVLVAEGLSNRAIAARLVISKRTVDAHIEHIYDKLGISTRVQLATWLKSA